ncbi:MAG: T9SS type A sorting domain-containing protein, partial [Ignavibacteriae bacterium]|nr:T9SS type A sorting domain-containing protein [Ignavibacteriota bacterium]
MKKTILHLFLTVFLISIYVNARGQNLYIGTDTLSSNYPLTTYWMDGRTDMLYLADEIIAAGGSPGYFTGIAFYVNHVDTLTMNGFNIKMANTSDTSLTGFNQSWDVVYSGTFKVQNTGWQTVYFNQNFGWNGGTNVIIEVCYNNNRYTWFSTVRSTVKPGKTYGVYQDLPNGSGCTDLITGAVQQRRPNINLYFTPLTGIANTGNVPQKYSLSQNYPNPFNPETRISYSLPKAGFVSIKVFDMLGRQVADLVNDYKKAGNYITEFNASDLSSGVYY